MGEIRKITFNPESKKGIEGYRVQRHHDIIKSSGSAKRCAILEAGWCGTNKQCT
jgi:hypothetical protein